MRAARLAAAGAVVALVAGCARAGAVEVVRSDAEREVIDVSAAPAVGDLVSATTALGQAALTTAPSGENALLSPASVVIALAMVAEGADGTTAAELDHLLGASGQDRTDAVNALLGSLQEYDADPGTVDEDALPATPVLHVANAVVVDDDHEVGQDFLDTLARAYSAGAHVTNLASEEGKRDLDSWVREHTAGRIDSSALQPDDALILVLQNAVYLAARWAQSFAAEATALQDFTLADSTRVQTATMHAVQDLAYAEIDGAQAVRLPYTEALAMDIVLPAPGHPTADLAAAAAALERAAPTQVQLSLPKVDMTGEADLVPLLQELGVRELFSPAADLSGITPDAFVGQAAHQAGLTLDEDGTVAAAVTEISAEAGALEPQDPLVLTVDRPFGLQVVHVQTGLPLFMGLVRDPRG